MEARTQPWDYLILTASNDAQARVYERRLSVRRAIGLLGGVDEVIVVPDPGGRRVGSGGSTLFCLLEVLRRRLGSKKTRSDRRYWQQVLGELRILIVHAGGDARRLPAYGPCGKAFVPVPGENDSAVCLTLFDRQLPTYLALPAPPQGGGQVVIASGDVLLRFDPSQVAFPQPGIIGLACYAQPEQASRHGVFCPARGNEVRLYLQKPSIDQQKQEGAVNAYGQSCLDIGVMHFDAGTAVELLRLFGARADKDGQLVLAGPKGRAVTQRGVDFYREICGALGNEGNLDHYVQTALGSGSKWTETMLSGLFDTLAAIPLHMQLLKHCDFLDFGTSRGIINSGTRMLQEDRGLSQLQSSLDVNNDVADGGAVRGTASWVEGCRIAAPLELGGSNVVVGVDVAEPLALPGGTCLDVLEGRDSKSRPVWFVRYYGIDDTFKEPLDEGAVFCGMDLRAWIESVGAREQEVWDRDVPRAERTIWNARLFPAVEQHAEFRRWQWMLEPAGASEAQHAAWRDASRYSLEDILALADQEAFFERRAGIRARVVRGTLQQIFHPKGGLSARELTYLLRDASEMSVWVAEMVGQAHRAFEAGRDGTTASLVFPRIIHTLGSALLEVARDKRRAVARALRDAGTALAPSVRRWLKSLELDLEGTVKAEKWCRRAQAVGFEALEDAIVGSAATETERARSVLRSDEIVWARAPARLDVGGGWTDTPPYSLEWGGCVTNAAVNLNGQPPIQAYVRVIDEPVIRIGSIDLGARIEIRNFENLLDYRQATGSFALAKAAIVLSGLSPDGSGRGRKRTLKQALEAFGGGIELTTLAAIPKGSGLGTSSIMGAVIAAALARVTGRQLSQRELFHSVLRLEQALTTGGGWQDQIGGVVDGVKMIVTDPGMVPDAHIHYVPSDVIDPHRNGGCTLLYYTGITRLAKNILQQVVARYLNRDRATVTTLQHIGSAARDAMDAFIRKDIERFGHLVDTAWQLNKRLDPNSSNDEIEALLTRVGPHIYGAKLLGAGGGGFLLMVCKSPAAAAAVRELLDHDPPNSRARFFDYDVSSEGLAVTVC